MALDGIVLNRLTKELKEQIVGKKINKIYLASNDSYIFNLRDINLLISTSSAYPRVYTTKTDYSKEDKSNNFELNLRRYLEGSIIEDINQVGLDRIIEISFLALNDFKEKVHLKIICELMGKYSNIILVNEDNEILDCARHITSIISRVRTLLPKGIYNRIIDEEKYDILDFINLSEIDRKIKLESIINKDNNSSLGLSTFLSKNFYGISKSFAINFENTFDLCFVNFTSINFFINYIQRILDDNSNESYKIYFDGDTPVDFHVAHIDSNANMKSITYNSISELIEAFYEKRAINNAIRNRSQDLKLILTNIMAKDFKKKNIHQRNIKECKNLDDYKMLGDLIFANLYRISSGDKQVVVANFYDDYKEIYIDLDPNLSPSENANRYYKKYNKMKSTLKNSTMQLKEIDEEIVYLETVISYLDNAQNKDDIESIRQELIEGGYLKNKIKDTKNKLKNKLKNKIKNKKKDVTEEAYKFISSDGFEIYIGKNNIQNDELTFKVGKDTDIWMHVQDIPGSHVIIKTNGKGEDIPDNTLLEAANLGVYFSKGRESSKVPIDYTLRKFVKKPTGAKPGFVIFLNNKTLFITPEKEILKRFNIML